MRHISRRLVRNTSQIVNIRTKVVVLLSAVFLAFALVEWGVGEALLLPRFEQIELDNARTAMTRIDFGVHQTLAGLEVSATDWGNWANTYRFIQDHNADYRSENLHPTAMKQLHLSALAFIDAEGNFVWSHAVDATTGAAVALDLFRYSSLPANFPWQQNLRNARSGQGLIATNRGVLLVAVAPILDGFGRGPSRGLVVMGRLLTHAEVADIGARSQTSVALTAIRNTADGAPQLLARRGQVPTGDEITTTDAMTQVSRVFNDLYGQPVMTLRVDVPRTIAARARTTVAYAMAFTVGAAVAVLLLLLAVLDRMVLAPLHRVTGHAIAIGAGDDLTTRLNLDRADEIGALAIEFDRMVAQVAESRRRQIDHSFDAGMAELSRGVLHNIGNAMTPLGVRVAKLQQQLLAAPTADVERALAERGLVSSDADRLADLDEFLRLASGDLAELIKAAESDAGVIARQAGIVQNALTEQLQPLHGATGADEPVDLPAIVSQSLEIVPDACREQVNVELDRSLQAVGPVRLARTVLRLVLQNLIINAAEAVQTAARGRGVVRFSATMISELGDHKLLLECEDTGVGIAAENLERVFERGYSTKRRSGNLGIGLHWCATAVGALGGRIWATSDGPGRGSTMHLLMPVSSPTVIASTEAA
jgi:two-component system NtrC family sensor kinase